MFAPMIFALEEIILKVTYRDVHFLETFTSAYYNNLFEGQQSFALEHVCIIERKTVKFVKYKKNVTVYEHSLVRRTFLYIVYIFGADVKQPL